MSRIKVFILNSNNTDIESDSLLSWYDSQDPNGFVFEPSLEGIIRQSKDLDIPIDVEKSNYEELPSKTDSNLVILLNENSMISSKYLLNIVSLNNMYPDFPILCGNIENHYTGVRDDFFIKKIAPIITHIMSFLLTVLCFRTYLKIFQTYLRLIIYQ